MLPQSKFLLLLYTRAIKNVNRLWSMGSHDICPQKAACCWKPLPAHPTVRQMLKQRWQRQQLTSLLESLDVTEWTSPWAFNTDGQSFRSESSFLCSVVESWLQLNNRTKTKLPNPGGPASPGFLQLQEVSFEDCVGNFWWTPNFFFFFCGGAYLLRAFPNT